MTVIELTFLSGRYHSTPWGRHVNEGQPEWPPSPYRLLRTLYDAWKRKFAAWPPERVEPFLSALAASPPSFRLPPVNLSHTRAFLPTNRIDASDRKLIFDGFVVLDPTQVVFMGWPDLTLEPSQQADLSELVGSIHYLGRSESWVQASLKTTSRGDLLSWNCKPISATADSDDPGLVVACAVPYEIFNRDGRRVKIVEKSASSKDPHSGSPWLQALAFSTRETMKGHLSDPPALSFVRYQAIPAAPALAAAIGKSDAPTQVNAVLYALESKVLPQVTATLEISERVRVKLMGIHRRVKGDPSLVSPRFSGKDPQGRALQGHQHSFIFPLDRDQDGRLDHLLICCRFDYTESEIIAFDHLTSLWQPGGLPDILCVPLQLGSQAAMLQSSHRFGSATPFIPTHHHRKGRGSFFDWLKGEIYRECKQAGLPAPTEVTPLENLALPGGHRYFWLEFRRSRRQDNSRQGFGFKLTFPEPVRGPIALGYGSHFGLGMFIPAQP
jgi:CRISPR-associated protein Csb2